MLHLWSRNLLPPSQCDLTSCPVSAATLRTLGECCPAVEVLRLGSPVTDASAGRWAACGPCSVRLPCTNTLPPPAPGPLRPPRHHSETRHLGAPCQCAAGHRTPCLQGPARCDARSGPAAARAGGRVMGRAPGGGGRGGHGRQAGGRGAPHAAAEPGLAQHPLPAGGAVPHRLPQGGPQPRPRGGGAPAAAARMRPEHAAGCAALSGCGARRASGHVRRLAAALVAGTRNACKFAAGGAVRRGLRPTLPCPPDAPSACLPAEVAGSSRWELPEAEKKTPPVVHIAERFRLAYVSRQERVKAARERAWQQQKRREQRQTTAVDRLIEQWEGEL